MGTDIHGIWQKKTSSEWEDIESKYEQNRHYQLFAVLADVRNGIGFAGVATGESIVPIAEPRGLPTDFFMDGYQHPVKSLLFIDSRRRKYHNELLFNMGDHSFSWLTDEEVLGWYVNAPTVVKTGVLDRAIYETWDGVSPPSEYSGNVWGAGIIKAPLPNWTHIQCSWKQSLREELKYFFDEVARLKEEHGSIRFVFGFDS